jgi:hypothetical protein
MVKGQSNVINENSVGESKFVFQTDYSVAELAWISSSLFWVPSLYGQRLTHSYTIYMRQFCFYLFSVDDTAVGVYASQGAPGM